MIRWHLCGKRPAHIKCPSTSDKKKHEQQQQNHATTPNRLFSRLSHGAYRLIRFRLLQMSLGCKSSPQMPNAASIFGLSDVCGYAQDRHESVRMHTDSATETATARTKRDDKRRAVAANSAKSCVPLEYNAFGIYSEEIRGTCVCVSTSRTFRHVSRIGS